LCTRRWSVAVSVPTLERGNAFDFNSLDQVNFDAAGLDIGSSEIFVFVPKDRDENNVRSFKTFTVDLYSLASWLKECNIKKLFQWSQLVYIGSLFLKSLRIKDLILN